MENNSQSGNGAPKNGGQNPEYPEPQLIFENPKYDAWYPDTEKYEAAEANFWRRQNKIGVCSLVISACALGAAIVAGVIANNAYVETKRQADAAIRQVAIAQDTERHQLRAHILYDSVILNVDGQKMTAFLRFKNTAATPALGATYWWNIRAIEPTKVSALEFEDTNTVSVDVGNSGFLDTEDREILADDIKAARDRKKIIYIWGLVKYKDVFQRC